MRVWLPNVRARSGADVYAGRLASALRKRGVDAVVQWFPHAFQYFPWALRTYPLPTGFDVIDTTSWVAFAFRHASIPLVANVLHCVAGRGYPEWKSFPQAVFHDQMVRRFERSSLRTADAIVAISDSTTREVREDYGTKNVHTIPLWVDAQVFSPSPNAPKARSTCTRILIVGNMGRRKGGDLIGSFCEALGQDFDVTVVAGLRGSIPNISARGAGLKFISGLTTDQLVAAYRDTDIVVSLSRHEGFGYTALEGMACGKPVVAFDVSGLRDVIADGATGFLAPAGNVLALAGCCLRLRDNHGLSMQMGENGRERAVTVFSENRAVEAHLALYAELISRRGTNQ